MWVGFGCVKVLLCGLGGFVCSAALLVLWVIGFGFDDWFVVVSGVWVTCMFLVCFGNVTWIWGLAV